MSSAGSVLQVGRVAFEVSRFEVVGEWCQVEGQWFGVRGRRFMRPALTVAVDGRPVRLLADLADKPWAAEDGEPWKATFPYTITGDQSGEAELTVAPDVTITLPVPDRRGGAARKKSTSRRGHPSRQSAVRPTSNHALLHQLTELRDTERRLRAQLARMEAERAETTERLLEASRELLEAKHEREEYHTARDRIAAELEAVQRELSELVSEREAAVRERDQMATDRETALRTHDEALQASEAAGVARDRALTEHGAALAAQEQAASERDAAFAARDQAVAERDAARSLCHEALSLRDEALAARDAAVSDREALSRSTEQLKSQLTDLSSSAGAALVMRRAAQAGSGIGGGQGRSIFLRRTRSSVIPGALTFAVIVVILLVWVFLLRGF
jgi:hypothetical protein